MSSKPKPNPLLDAIDKLTTVHVITTKLDDDSTHHEHHDGLIPQLRQAIASNLGGGAGGKPARERIPLDADALTKYQQIEEAIEQRYVDLLETAPELYPEGNLRAWYVAFAQTHQPSTADRPDREYDDELATMESWARTINEKLSPPTIRELLGEACPDCGFSWFDTLLNAGKPETGKERWFDVDRTVALKVTYRPDDRGGLTKSFAKCGCCGHVWMGASGIRELAWTLEQRHGVSAADEKIERA